MQVKRWVGNVAYIGEKRLAYEIFVGKPEGNRPLGRRRVTGIVLEWVLEK